MDYGNCWFAIRRVRVCAQLITPSRDQVINNLLEDDKWANNFYAFEQIVCEHTGNIQTDMDSALY